MEQEHTQKSKSIRKVLLILFGFGFLLSILNIVLSLLATAGYGSQVLKNGIVNSTYVISLSILISMYLSKKSLLWFLLPLLPILISGIYSSKFNTEFVNSQTEYCKKAIATYTYEQMVSMNAQDCYDQVK